MSKYNSLSSALNNFVELKLNKQYSTGDITRAKRTGVGIYNVMDYGAKGNDEFDNTVILQKIIDTIEAKGSGVMYFPRGIYRISSALNLCTNLTIQGDGGHISIIKQITDDEDGLYALDKHNMCFYSIGVYGTNGQYVKNGTGTGIKLNRDSNPNLTYCSFYDVWVYRFGQDGIDITTILVSTFDKVHCEENGRCGFWFHRKGETTPDVEPGSPIQAPCTSCTFNACYANSNYEYGFYLSHCVYFNLAGCACDGTSTLGQTKKGYVINFGQGISLTGCAAESISEYNFMFIKTCYGCGLFQPWVYDLGLSAVCVHFETGCKQCQVIGGAQTDPRTPVTGIAIQTESNCRVTVIGFRGGDADDDITSGTATLIDYGADSTQGSIFPNRLYSLEMYVDYIGNNEGSTLEIDCNMEVYGDMGTAWYRLFGVAAASVPNKSIFLDSSDGLLKWKDNSGTLNTFSFV